MPENDAFNDIDPGDPAAVAPPTEGEAKPTTPVAQPTQPTAEAAGDPAAAALLEAYKAIPGVPADLIKGSTVAEVRASYEAAVALKATVREQVMAELQADIPTARGGQGAPDVPGTALGKIGLGLQQSQAAK